MSGSDELRFFIAVAEPRLEAQVVSLFTPYGSVSSCRSIAALADSLELAGRSAGVVISVEQPYSDGITQLVRLSDRLSGIPRLLVADEVDTTVINRAARAGLSLLVHPFCAEDIRPYVERVKRAATCTVSALSLVTSEFVEKNRLSRREAEILSLSIRGSRSLAIADQMGISRKTLENHIASILKKSGCARFDQVAADALRDVVLRMAPRVADELRRNP
jgi:DNA-binding NarL/FixJ family response regulator